MSEHPVAAPERYPSGKKKKPYGPPRTKWRRMRDNIENLERLGGHANWGTVLGLYRMRYRDNTTERILTESQYNAGLVYGRVAGRYRRFHADESLPITAPSPAFQRGSRGRDNELDRLAMEGRLPEYEREANRARRAWKKLQSVVPDLASRELIEEVCIYDREIPEIKQRDLAVLLSAVAGRFFGRSGKTPRPWRG